MYVVVSVVVVVVVVVVACVRQSEKECMCARCRHCANVYVGIVFCVRGLYHCLELMFFQ